MNPTTYSILEIHSDAISLLICAVVLEGDHIHHKSVERLGEVVELSSELAADNKICPTSIAKLETILRRYGKLARKNSGTVFVAATGAVARATNATEIFSKLSCAAGEPIRLMSSEREAQLACSSLIERLDSAGSQLLIDAGSSFTYVAVTDGRKIVDETILPVGTTGLSAILAGDPPGALSWSLLASKVGFALHDLPEGEPVRAWVTGSAAHNLVGLDRTDDQARDHILKMPRLSELADDLMKVPVKKLARRLGEDPRRIVLLPPGLVIVSSILDRYGLSEATVVAEGIREGIIHAGVACPETWWQD